MFDKLAVDGWGGDMGEIPLCHLVGAILMERHDEWPLPHCYIHLKAMAELSPPHKDAQPLFPPKVA